VLVALILRLKGNGARPRWLPETIYFGGHAVRSEDLNKPVSKTASVLVLIAVALLPLILILAIVYALWSRR